MRARGDATPVLFLSAKGQVEDRVQGLRAGGDDYLPKPFHLPEFLLRVENMLRRQDWGSGTLTGTNDTLRFGGHKVDFRTWTATLAGGRQEPLGERELKILKLFHERRGEVVSRDDILDGVWGDDAFPSSRTVDNFVVRLRRLFEPDAATPRYFHTVWGVGYRFVSEDETATSNEP
jgi:two-component system alkaline phosphatase synthesis response regulator PhoP